MGVRKKKKREGRGTGEMALQVKVPDTEPDGLSWILGMSLNPGPDILRSTNSSKNVLSTFHKCTVVHMCPTPT